MKEDQDYARDITEIRSMMERSSKFLSLSGLAGIMAGIYALAGAYIAYVFFAFNPDRVMYDASGSLASGLWKVLWLASLILVLAVGTAMLLSAKKAHKRGERVWNASARRLLGNMAVPLVAGGLLVLVLLSQGLIGFIAPFTLVFYGLALYNAGGVTYGEVRILGLIEIGLGLMGASMVEYGLLCWAFGFGILHIVYGIYIHYKYER